MKVDVSEPSTVEVPIRGKAPTEKPIQPVLDLSSTQKTTLTAKLAFDCVAILVSPFSERGGSRLKSIGYPDPGGPCGKGILGRTWRRVLDLDSVLDTSSWAGGTVVVVDDLDGMGSMWAGWGGSVRCRDSAGMGMEWSDDDVVRFDGRVVDVEADERDGGVGSA